jgi:hypothetical protein
MKRMLDFVPMIAAAAFLLVVATPAQAQTPTNWCDCMRYKKKSFQTGPWTSEREGRCTRFSASTRQACRAQGKGAVIDFDKKR